MFNGTNLILGPDVDQNKLMFDWFIGVSKMYDFNVYCRELAPGTVSLTGDKAQGDDSKQCA